MTEILAPKWQPFWSFWLVIFHSMSLTVKGQGKWVFVRTMQLCSISSKSYPEGWCREGKEPMMSSESERGPMGITALYILPSPGQPRSLRARCSLLWQCPWVASQPATPFLHARLTPCQTLWLNFNITKTDWDPTWHENKRTFSVNTLNKMTLHTHKTPPTLKHEYFVNMNEKTWSQLDRKWVGLSINPRALAEISVL